MPLPLPATGRSWGSCAHRSPRRSGSSAEKSWPLIYISTSPQNYTAYANSQVDTWFSQQSQTIDQKQRRATVDQIQQKLMEEVPALFTFISNAHYFYAGNLRGNRRSPLNANAERLEARGMYSVS